MNMYSLCFFATLGIKVMSLFQSARQSSPLTGLRLPVVRKFILEVMCVVSDCVIELNFHETNKKNQFILHLCGRRTFMIMTKEKDHDLRYSYNRQQSFNSSG